MNSLPSKTNCKPPRVKSSTRRRRRTAFYLSSALKLAIPGWCFRLRRSGLLADLTRESHPELFERVDYYCQLNDTFTPSPEARRFRDIPIGHPSTYYFDFREVFRWFPRDRSVDYQFGDIIAVPDSPAFVKSRPIASDGSNANSILLKWNKIRHYYFITNDQPFSAKQARVVWRGKCGAKPNRLRFLERYIDDPRCDIGDTDKRSLGTPLNRPFMTIPDQLGFKYIISLEGNDVATNTKWIMSSNSLCLMPKPRFETWFMEGRLKAGEHYVELADDCADLGDKIDYYEAHPAEAEAIIANAQAWVDQFRDMRREHLLQLLVVQRYLELSGQMSA